MASRSTSAPIIFLHGLGGSKQDWDDVIKHLPKKRPALAIDLPGLSGRKPEPKLDPLELAAHVLTAVRHTHTPPFHFCGHSLGGRVVGEIAATHPDMAASICLISPLGASGYGFTDRMKWKAMSRSAVLRNVSDEQMRRALSYGFTGHGKPKAAFIERAMAARTGPHAAESLKALEKYVDGVIDSPPLNRQLDRSRVKALIIAGEDDPLAPSAEVKKLHLAIHGSKFVELPGGHYPMLEDPARLATLISSFIESA
jgi:pimeloyl-ACP methyl ester carboxylesterase